jgi:hypothetical protein
LTRAIAKAFENRSVDRDGDLLDQTALRGTLKAIRDQTSAFRWDLMLSAVKAKLATQDDTCAYKPYEARPLPFAILQGLLDAFAIVQRLPEQTLLKITTFEGVSTLVVWVHLVLGLVVVVFIDDKVIRFGEGKENMIIQTCSSLSSATGDPPRLSLFRSVEEPHRVFEITSDREEDDEYRLTPVTLHCAGGIGIKLLSDEIDDEKVIRELAHRIVASCILKAREANDSRPTSHLTLGSFSVPTEEKIIAAGALIFENLDYPNEVMLELLGEACIATCPWDEDNLPSIFLDWLALPSSMRRRGTCTSIWRLDRSLPKVDDSADVRGHPSFSRSPVGLQTGDTARTRRGLEDGAQTTRPNRFASRLPLQKLIRSLCTLVFALHSRFRVLVRFERSGMQRHAAEPVQHPKCQFHRVLSFTWYTIDHNTYSAQNLGQYATWAFVRCCKNGQSQYY